MSEKLEVQAAKHGRGVFAKEPVRKGQVFVFHIFLSKGCCILRFKYGSFGRTMICLTFVFFCFLAFNLNCRLTGLTTCSLMD